MPVLDPYALIENRVQAIRDLHRRSHLGRARSHLDRAQLDVSGGVDSATMLMLLARALGPEKVSAVYSSIDSSPTSRLRARAVAQAAGVNLIELDLLGAFHAVEDQIWSALVTSGVAEGHDGGYSEAQLAQHDLKPGMEAIRWRCEKDPVIRGSFRSCLRAPVGRFVNRILGNGIRHGTGNEDEDRWLRFYQKGGDGEVDCNPLAMLSKGEVYQLAHALGVPREILEATPSPDLWGEDNHTDEEELRALSGVDWTYSRIDLETGEYTKVGTIERLSRFLDHQFAAWFDGLCGINGGWLFAKDEGRDEISGHWKFNMDALVEQAKQFFDPDYSKNQVRAFLESARKWERVTRHKFNPNIPTLGTRKELKEAGILTDELPEL